MEWFISSCDVYKTMLTSKEGSIDGGHTAIPSSIHWNNSELKQVTWAGAGHCKVEPGLIHIAAISEHSADIVDLYAVPEVRVYAREVQRERRGPSDEDECVPRVYFKTSHCT